MGNTSIDFSTIISDRIIAKEAIKKEIKLILDYPFTYIGINIDLPINENNLFKMYFIFYLCLLFLLKLFNLY